MKRYLRFCLIFLLCLSLPLIGMAGVQASTEPCLMDAGDMTTINGTAWDCCQGTKSPLDHSKSCKPGQECKSGTLFQITGVKQPIGWSHPIGVSFSNDSFPLQVPSGVWRPPRG
ncbi:hypothetical protein ACIPZ8_01495 [Pseudomonas sp. NPDC089422]|uniref:hypothetical protein n=1 Tax=Pseudomonas sp. NPDC089422 TaxID=3364466 RepID=UPI0037F63377